MATLYNLRMRRLTRLQQHYDFCLNYIIKSMDSGWCDIGMLDACVDIVNALPKKIERLKRLTEEKNG